MKIDANSSIIKLSKLEQKSQEVVKNSSAEPFGVNGAVFKSNGNQMYVEKTCDDKEKACAGNEPDSSATMNSKEQLTTLANIITEKDLNELDKQGEDAEEQSVDVIVTVVDKIKTQLAVYCDDYEPVINDLSSEQLQKIAGTSQNAVHIANKLKENQLPVTQDNISETESAMEMAAGISNLSESAKVYAVQNGLDMTIEDLYTAEFSSTDTVSYYANGQGYYEDGINGYYAKTAQDVQLDKLQAQMEKVISQAGLEVNNETMGQASWLLEHQLPLTDKTINQINTIENTEIPVDSEVILDNIMQAIKEGKRPVQADICTQEDMIGRCQEALRVIQETTGEQLSSVLNEQSEVTIQALKNVQNTMIQEGILNETAPDKVSVNESITTNDISWITARRQLEEIRLQMTLEASVTMVKNGINIETESLQSLVEDLKNVEDNYYKNLLDAADVDSSEENTALFKEITESVKSVASAPVQILGIVAFDKTKQTISAMQQEGTVASQKYQAAEAAYETVMTKPRADMGDSIQKAFRNVDDIIDDMNLESTEANKRGVRILGYNGIEITEDNLFKVKAIDQEVNKLIKSMTPSKVIGMIREGYNPLHESVQNVNEKLTQMNEGSSASEEKYSEYLYKLENNNEISEEERNAYIGIYRLLHQVEKSDGAVVGALVMQGADITMKNLMTGIRSKKQMSMDYRVGNETGVLQQTSGNTNITDQIEAGFTDYEEQAGYYQNLVSEALDGMDPQTISNMADNQDIMNMTLESFVDVIAAESENPVVNDKYLEEKLARIQEGAKAETQVISLLEDNGQTVSLNNLSAAGELFYKSGDLFRKLMMQSEKDEQTKEDFSQVLEDTEDGFSDSESAQEAYSRLVDVAEKVVESGVEQADVTYNEMKEWKLLHSQICLVGNLGKQENYQVPVMLGDKLATLQLNFQHSDEESKVSITTQTDETGKIGAEFTVQGDSVSAYFACDTQDGKMLLQSMQEAISSLIKTNTGFTMGKINYAQYEDMDLNRFSQKDKKGTKEVKKDASSKELYQIAKAFITVLHTKFE